MNTQRLKLRKAATESPSELETEALSRPNHTRPYDRGRSRSAQAEAVKQAFPPSAEHSQISDELAPVPGEPVFQKLGMSALVGTPVEAALRDRGVTTIVLVGAVLEIGIEPTARRAADLGFLPVVVEDACGVVEPEAAARALASLDYTLMCYRCSAEAVIQALRP